MDKRSFSRIHFQTEAIVRYRDREIACEVVNLRLNGAFLSIPDKIPLGEEVDAKILLSGTSSELSVKVKGKIIRLNDDGLALQFTGMDLDSFIHLKNIVAYNTENVAKTEKEFEEFLWGKDPF